MACTITLVNSRKLPCMRSRVGIRAVYIVQFNRQDTIQTTTAGVVELPTYITSPLTPSVARYDVKSTTINYTDTRTQNLDNRSFGSKGELPIILIPGEGVDNVVLAEEVEQWSKTETLVFLEYKSGEFFAIGSQFGCNISTSVDTSGGQSGDLNGKTITIQTDESEDYRKYWLTPAAVTELITATLPDA